MGLPGVGLHGRPRPESALGYGTGRLASSFTLPRSTTRSSLSLMSDLTVIIRAILPGTIDRTREEIVHVPEAYAEEDVRQFIGHAVESIGARMLREQQLPTPVRTTLLGNAARLSRLEELVNEFFQDHSLPSSTLDRLRELFLVDAPEAIRRWGGPVIEVDGEDVVNDGDEDPNA